MANHTWITLNRPDTCAECGMRLEPGDKAYYELNSHNTHSGRTVYCEDCAKSLEQTNN